MSEFIHKAHSLEREYVSLKNKDVQRKDLSYEATGMLVYLMSLPHDWNINLRNLQQKGAGRDKVRRILKELEDKGYLSIENSKDEQGRFTHTQYHAYATPDYNPQFNPSTENPFTENPSTANPSTENLQLQKKDSKKEIITNGETSFSQSFETLIINELSSDTWLSESSLASKINVDIDDLSQIVASHPAQVTLEMLVDKGTITKSQRIGDTSERHYQIATSQDKTKPTIISGNGKKNYRQTLIEAIETITEIPAAKSDEGLYFKIAKELVESGIGLDDFQRHYDFVVAESKETGDWNVTVTSLTSNGRVSRSIADRDNPSEDYHSQDEIEVYGF